MKQKLGERGELLSKKYLIDRGYYLLSSNFRTKLGEIDIIAQLGNLIVFIEVKTRKTVAYGLPREAVNYRKQLTIKKVAQQYIQQKKIKDVDFRFDVIEVLLENNKYQINHIENAF